MKPKPALKTPGAAPFAESAHHAGTDAETADSKPSLKRILVPLDFSPCAFRALDYALMLAEAFEASLILLHVVEPAGFGVSSETEEQLESELRARRARLLEIDRKRLGRRVPSEALVRIGRAWSEIPDTARALGADLIVVGLQGESPFAKSFPGSTAEGVLRHARCAVLTVA